jgi:hypothetical protein
MPPSEFSNSSQAIGAPAALRSLLQSSSVSDMTQLTASYLASQLLTSSTLLTVSNAQYTGNSNAVCFLQFGLNSTPRCHSLITQACLA